MAHDVIIACNKYSGVPAVILTDPANGNDVRYTDTSDATVTAADIATGKTAYGADGLKITGTASGGSSGGGSASDVYKKWAEGDYDGYNVKIPDEILNETKLKKYAIAGYLNMSDTDLTFPNLLSIPSDCFSSDIYISKITAPNVTSIGISGCSGLSNLTEFNAPKVVTISNSAFVMCSDLTAVNFPLCKTVEMNAFQSCFSLATVDLGAATSIAMYAFSDCSALATLILRGDTVCTLKDANALGYSSWDKSTPLAKLTGSIYVPDKLVDSYKTATNWSIFASIIKPLSSYTAS